MRSDLLLFAIARKFDITRTKSLILNYHKFVVANGYQDGFVQADVNEQLLRSRYLTPLHLTLSDSTGFSTDLMGERTW